MTQVSCLSYTWLSTKNTCYHTNAIGSYTRECGLEQVSRGPKNNIASAETLSLIVHCHCPMVAGDSSGDHRHDMAALGLDRRTGRWRRRRLLLHDVHRRKAGPETNPERT